MMKLTLPGASSLANNLVFEVETMGDYDDPNMVSVHLWPREIPADRLVRISALASRHPPQSERKR